MVAVETKLKRQQVYHVKPGRAPDNSEYELPRLNSQPNVLVPTLNAPGTVGIIAELRFKPDLNLVGLYAFIVEKMDDDSLVILEKSRRYTGSRRLFAHFLSIREMSFEMTCRILR
jgi:hypothetical protein